jgi:hypothetical protein
MTTKKKTATIVIRHIWGTKSSMAADVLYRGKVLTYFMDNDSKALIERARVWSVNQGFTHINYQM